MGFIIHKYVLSKSLKAPAPSGNSGGGGGGHQNKKREKSKQRRYSSAGAPVLDEHLTIPEHAYAGNSVPNLSYSSMTSKKKKNNNNNNNNNNNHYHSLHGTSISTHSSSNNNPSRRRRNSMSSLTKSQSFRRSSMPMLGTATSIAEGPHGMEDSVSSFGSNTTSNTNTTTNRRASLQTISSYQQQNNSEDDDDDQHHHHHQVQTNFGMQGGMTECDPSYATYYTSNGKIDVTQSRYRNMNTDSETTVHTNDDDDYGDEEASMDLYGYEPATPEKRQSSTYHNNNNNNNHLQRRYSTSSGYSFGEESYNTEENDDDDGVSVEDRMEGGGNNDSSNIYNNNMRGSRVLRQENSLLHRQLKYSQERCKKLEVQLYGTRDQLAYTDASWKQQWQHVQQQHQQEVFQTQRQAEAASNAILEKEFSELRSALDRAIQEEGILAVAGESHTQNNSEEKVGSKNNDDDDDDDDDDDATPIEQYDVKRLHSELVEWKNRHAEVTASAQLLEEEATERNALLQESLRRVAWLEEQLQAAVPILDNFDREEDDGHGEVPSSESSTAINPHLVTVLQDQQSQLEDRIQDLLIENAELQSSNSETYELQQKAKELEELLVNAKNEKEHQDKEHNRQMTQLRENAAKWEAKAKLLEETMSKGKNGQQNGQGFLDTKSESTEQVEEQTTGRAIDTLAAKIELMDDNAEDTSLVVDIPSGLHTRRDKATDRTVDTDSSYSSSTS